MHKNSIQFLAALIVCVFLAACAKPVPQEKINYVGQWHASAMRLWISQDGSVDYKRVQGGMTTKISGPLQKFEGDDFFVGFSFMTAKFVVSKPPYHDGGKWKMVVDGVELSRAG